MNHTKLFLTLIAATGVILLPLTGLFSLAALVSDASTGPGSLSQLPSALASSQIPATWLALAQQAAKDNGVCTMSWTILASIAFEESSFGTSSLPGVHSDANSAGAEGPMQFLPSTFASVPPNAWPTYSGTSESAQGILE